MRVPKYGEHPAAYFTAGLEFHNPDMKLIKFTIVGPRRVLSGVY